MRGSETEKPDSALIEMTDQLTKKDDEILILQDLATEFAAARDKEDLLQITRNKLRSLFAFWEIGVGTINNDGCTISPFLFELDGMSTTHPRYKEMLHMKYPIRDRIYDRTLDSAEPVMFYLAEMARKGPLPEYFQVQLESGVSRILMTRLRTGEKAVGVMGMTLADDKPLSPEQLSLVKYISHLMAIAVSNVLANEDVQRRQQEKETILSLSTDIAAARTVEDLMILIRQKLKKLLGYTNTGLTSLDKEKKICTSIVLDPQSTCRSHPDYKKAITDRYRLYDGLAFEKAFASDKPVVFSLKDMAKQNGMPTYVTVPFESGLKIMCITRLSHGEEVFGFWFVYYDDEAALDDGRFRLIEGLSNQLSVALSNILANEIIARNLQAVSNQKQQLKEEKVYLMEEIAKSNNSWDIVGEGRAMQTVFQLVSQVATSDSTVLIQGETGTGKELIARALHNYSHRRQKMMVKVNCAALPPNLIESELFGHERGAFTGAIERRIGKFELAHDGTLFLDEVGELPLELQAKLLRALQEREIERVGGRTTIKVNVRIVAATNRDLEKEMREGRFRSDLYYRLNIFPIQLPPLRERREDIPVLAAHFIKLHIKKIGKRIEALSTAAMAEMMKYDWPGNIRELENILERSILLASGDTIQKVYLPTAKWDLPTHRENEIPVRLQSLADNEKQHILSILKYCGEQISGKNGAASILRIPPSTLISRMKRLGIKKEHIDAGQLAKATSY
jgi:transcriptional regulator with GAF, ATPase, and Fis domain